MYRLESQLIRRPARAAGAGRGAGGGRGGALSRGGYIQKLPDDPWGSPYHYAAPGQHGAVDSVAMARTAGKAAKE